MKNDVRPYRTVLPNLALKGSASLHKAFSIHFTLVGCTTIRFEKQLFPLLQKQPLNYPLPNNGGQVVSKQLYKHASQEFCLQDSAGHGVC